ncbi:hypothetical protein PTKIN_Ptkin07bG0087700 [Pterospermum kingtungense]
MSHDVAKRLGRKIGNLNETNLKPYTLGCGRNLRLKVDIDIIKSLRRFVTITMGNGEFECDQAENNKGGMVKKYKDWLRASPSLRNAIGVSTLVGANRGGFNSCSVSNT